MDYGSVAYSVSKMGGILFLGYPIKVGVYFGSEGEFCECRM